MGNNLSLPDIRNLCDRRLGFAVYEWQMTPPGCYRSGLGQR